MRNVLWYLIAGTRGGETRGHIIALLKKQPCNAHKLSQLLGLDYKTIRHHLDVLEKNNVIVAVNKGHYGAVYFLSEEMQRHLNVFGEIWAQFGKK